MTFDDQERRTIAIDLGRLAGDCIAAAICIADEGTYNVQGLVLAKIVRDKAQAIFVKLQAEAAD